MVTVTNVIIALRMGIMMVKITKLLIVNKIILVKVTIEKQQQKRLVN